MHRARQPPVYRSCLVDCADWRPWRDLPPEFGKWYTAYTRYNRWEKKRVWPHVVEALQARGARELSYDRGGLRWASAPGLAVTPEFAAGKAAA